MTRDLLSELAIKYGSDRHPESKHSYTPYYYGLFKDKRDSVRKVLEIGVGEGAGLRMWRDFFPNATIYGAEQNPNRIFKDERIETILCDQTSVTDLKELINQTGTDIDFVIDDGSHVPSDQILTCQTLMPYLKNNALYIIEDVFDLTIIKELSNYEIEVPKLIRWRKRYDDWLIVVRKEFISSHPEPSESVPDYFARKYSLDVNKGQVVKIENISGSLELAEIFRELNFNIGAEIGVDRGGYAETLCQENQNLHLYGIDPWEPTAYEIGVSGMPTDQGYFDSCYGEAKARLAPYNCTIIKKNSMDALDHFKDNSLDFVYIDANHDFINFTKDLHYWIKKVRIGGIVAGHDYDDYPFNKMNHVKAALNAYAASYLLFPLFVIATPRKLIKLARDKRHSWFWIKK